MGGLTSTDLGQMLINFRPLFGVLELLVRGIAGLVGLYLFVSGIHIMIKVSANRHDRQSAGQQIFGCLVIGGALMRYAWFMPALWNTLFSGGGHSGIYSYTNVAGPGPYAAVIEAVFEFVQLCGWVFGFTGLLAWKRASADGGQNELVAGGSIRLFAGLGCIQIGDFVQMVLNQATAA